MKENGINGIIAFAFMFLAFGLAIFFDWLSKVSYC